VIAVACVGSEGTDRDRRAELEGGGGPMSVAVAEDAVLDEMEASSRLAGGPYCASGAANERGSVCVTRSKPATADSTPVKWLVDCDIVRVRILDAVLVFLCISFADEVPFRSGASEKGPRPCHISQKTMWPSMSTGLKKHARSAA